MEGERKYQHIMLSYIIIMKPEPQIRFATISIQSFGIMIRL